MGVTGSGFFVADEVRDQVALSVATADIATPNALEIAAAREGGHRELPLVAAQSELVAPSRIFEAEALR